MRRIYFIILIIFLFSGQVLSQTKLIPVSKGKIDSLMTRYHIETIKIYVNKVGILSLKDNTLSLRRKEFNNKMMITVYRSLSLSEERYGARFDYELKDPWIIRAETVRRSWGQQTGLNLLYQIEY